MRRWLTEEVSLDELLGDEIMGPVVASAGMDREQFRLTLAEVARRLTGQCRGRHGGGEACCSAVGG